MTTRVQKLSLTTRQFSESTMSQNRHRRAEHAILANTGREKEEPKHQGVSNSHVLGMGSNQQSRRWSGPRGHQEGVARRIPIIWSSSENTLQGEKERTSRRASVIFVCAAVFFMAQPSVMRSSSPFYLFAPVLRTVAFLSRVHINQASEHCCSEQFVDMSKPCVVVVSAILAFLNWVIRGENLSLSQ